jgi:hypothetical protein
LLVLSSSKTKTVEPRPQADRQIGAMKYYVKTCRAVNALHRWQSAEKPGNHLSIRCARRGTICG